MHMHRQKSSHSLNTSSDDLLLATILYRRRPSFCSVSVLRRDCKPSHFIRTKSG